ncbi:MAG: hypothetical protein OHK93_004739 [Ramalina farinacea]|uniref:Heterokaryon incompatibility domain-containing protein n=1 Tax=Ramalina farinacea TaxID=258253 RepID=A0AA43QUS0_9LECA|nr:hypothetical protein [Ramalina farinacea]
MAESPAAHLQCFQAMDVSEENKLALLRNDPAAFPEAIDEAKSLLSEIERLCPDEAQQFGLKKDIIGSVPFKLLHEPASQSGNNATGVGMHFESYITLSYCWRCADWTPTEGLGDVAPGWPISCRMLRSLLQQRRGFNEGIWVDERCINQSDESEKSHAISAMDLIYKRARLVVVAIEDVSFSEAEALVIQRFVADAEADADGDERPSLGDEVLFQILVKLASARWFQRAWCSHEFQLSKDLVFLLATENDILELPIAVLQNLGTIAFKTARPAEARNELMRATSFICQLIWRSTERPKGDRSYRTIKMDFSTIDRLKCNVETDKISISLNIAGLQVYYMGRRQSRDQCRWLLAIITLCTGDATVFGGDRGFLRRRTSILDGLD